MAAMEIAAAVAELVAKHCTDVVMSPGSRNSPLAYALLARRDVRVHSVSTSAPLPSPPSVWHECSAATSAW